MTRLAETGNCSSLERLEPQGDCPTLDVIFTGGNLFILGRPDFDPHQTYTYPDNGLDIQVTHKSDLDRRSVTVTEKKAG